MKSRPSCVASVADESGLPRPRTEVSVRRGGTDTGRPLRVAMVHYRDDAAVGGSLRVGELLANHLDPHKVEAHLVFAYGRPGPVTQNARVPCHFLGARGPGDLAAWLRARSIMRRLRPDIIHFHDAVIWLQVALAAEDYRRLLHVHVRFIPAYMRWRDRLFWRVLARLADGQVCITHGARRALLELGWGRPERIWTVYNAIDHTHFEALPPKPLARARLGLPAQVKLMGVVSRLVASKGGADALEILGRLDPSWHLMFCGDGPERRRLEELSSRPALQGRVHFLGNLEDIRPAYAAMDVFLSPAHYEWFGLAIGEAMAAGVPVFGLAGDGEYREPENPLVTPENAVFVNRRVPTDYHAIESPKVLDEVTRRIAEYGEHPECFQPMVDRARTWVRERFSIPLHVQRMTDVYETVLEPGCAPDPARLGSQD